MTMFCALPHAWDRAYHIRMEVFYIRLSSARRRGVDSVAGIVVFGLMAVQGARFVPFMIGTGRRVRISTCRCGRSWASCRRARS